MAKTSKKKITTAIVAGATALALVLGGTFAWQSINQYALNEASDVINPGGRLHDDFNGSNKNVYVENFTDAATGEDIFARVRLDEYFEIVINKNAGDGVEKTEVITTGATRGDLDSYVTHIFGGSNATDDYWTWTTGGQATYMPTFNKDKDSLDADINGTYDGLDPDDDIHYDDYEEIADEKTDTAVYDADADNAPEGEKTYVEETHYVANTLNAELISMDGWFDLGCPVGEYWVYDSDGWVYWAAPIKPGTATGLLLDEIALSRVMDDSWYYAINVVAQFVTADDLGKTDATGFYADGETVSAKALELLKTIGVDTEGPVTVSTIDQLKDALANGEDVIISGVIENTEKAEIGALTYDILWHEGGTVSGGTLDLNGKSYGGLFINNENSWPEEGDGANAATLKDTVINSASTLGIYVQAIDAPVTIENVSITADNGGIYAEFGGETVTLNNVTVDASNNWTIEGYDWYNSAVAAANNANIVINGGSYEGKNAVYVFSSGATITINDGYFDGALKADAPQLVINGGTFTVDPSEFVDTETYNVVDNGDDTWTVEEIYNGDISYEELSIGAYDNFEVLDYEYESGIYEGITYGILAKLDYEEKYYLDSEKDLSGASYEVYKGTVYYDEEMEYEYISWSDETCSDITVSEHGALTIGTLTEEHYKIAVTYADGTTDDVTVGFFKQYFDVSGVEDQKAYDLKNATFTAKLTLPQEYFERLVHGDDSFKAVVENFNQDGQTANGVTVSEPTVDGTSYSWTVMFDAETAADDTSYSFIITPPETLAPYFHSYDVTILIGDWWVE